MGMRNSIRVMDIDGKGFAPEGYVIDVNITTHLTDEEGYTAGIVGSVSVHLTKGEAQELLAELSKAIG